MRGQYFVIFAGLLNLCINFDYWGYVDWEGKQIYIMKGKNDTLWCVLSFNVFSLLGFKFQIYVVIFPVTFFFSGDAVYISS